MEIRKKYQLIERKKAIRGIHFPKDKAEMIEARRRVVFDEFFLFAMALNLLKEKKEKRESLYQMKEQEACDQLLEQLPYELTGAQLRTWEAVKQDLCSD